MFGDSARAFMRTEGILSRLLLIATLTTIAPASVFAGTFITIPLGTYTANIQSNLIASGPLGHITATDATPFDIPPTGRNYDEVAVNAGHTLSTTVNVANVTDVFTLINGYSPSPRVVVGVITFNFSNGNSRSIDLVGGGNVRDFYRGRYSNTVVDGTTENAFTYDNAADGARTGNTRTGLAGTYVVDEQHFSLGTMGIGTTLTSIVISTPYGNQIASGVGRGTPIILGLTVVVPFYVASLPGAGRRVAALPRTAIPSATGHM
jgi:hypothetical protein